MTKAQQIDNVTAMMNETARLANSFVVADRGYWDKQYREHKSELFRLLAGPELAAPVDGCYCDECDEARGIEHS